MVPVLFPNYPRDEDLDRNIIRHLTDKMEFQQQEIIDAVTKNRLVRVSLKKSKKKTAVVIYSLVEAIYRGIFREVNLQRCFLCQSPYTWLYGEFPPKKSAFFKLAVY